MILRKPYAFLIKNFKLFHVLLVILMSYLLYKTNIVLKFFNEYLASSQLMQGQDFSSTTFNIWMFIVPFLIIIFLIVLLSVLFAKKKPFLFYLINIGVFIAVIIFYTLSLSMIEILEVQLIETKTIRFMHDMLLLLMVFQIISLVLTAIRATGFDIKKFDFGQDLEDLQIDSADSEEFEVSLDLDTAKLKRGIRRNIRYAKYIYLENKFLINMISLIVVAIVIFVVYLNINIYNKSYNEKQAFMATDFTMMVNKSMVTNRNYKAINISKDNSLVVVELKIKRNYNKQIALVPINVPLVIGSHKFYYTNKYRDALVDLGTTYSKTIIDKNFENILLAYEIPKDFVDMKMSVRYIDKINYTSRGINPRYVTINIKPIKIDQNETSKPIEASIKTNFDQNLFPNASMLIDKVSINDMFSEKYNLCITNKCFKSTEYIKPKLNTNYDKIVLKVEGELENTGNIKDMYDLITNYAYLSYQDTNRLIKVTDPITSLRTVNINKKNEYYFEIRDISKHKNIKLNIKLRNITYTYNIGGES